MSGILIPTDDPQHKRWVQADSPEAAAYRRSLKPHVKDKGCKGCHSHETPYGRPVVRHLAYHIAPFSRNGVWQRNVSQLRQRMGLFNGRRTVAIVTGPGLDAPGAVREEMGPDVDYMVYPNDPKLREVVTFLPLLDRCATTAPYDVTFYAHAKGVTRGPNTTVHRWAEIMYATCLDDWPAVEKALLTHPIAGSFKKPIHGFAGSKSAWHYSGTFYWLRNCKAFTRPTWREVDQQWWGNESWPGLHFRAEEAACLFFDGTHDLYDAIYFRDKVEPAFAEWRVAHAV